MVDVLNKLGVHCAVYGNHEFDFGVDLLEEHTKMMPFPWFLSNVYDRFTSETLVHGVVSSILEWNGLKIAFMGLVEEDWLDTLGTVDKNNIKYIDYVETADRLSAELRDKGVDLGIALTHTRWHNDVRLASESNGVDLILGGHGHEYGVLEVNGILIVKSGSEFRYLSKSDGVKDQDGTFKYSCEKIATMKDLEEDAEIQQSVKGYTDNMQHMFGEVLCHIEVAMDGHYAAVRRAECSLGNLIIYAMLEATRAEVAFLNSGNQILSTVVINHFESGQIVRCTKRHKSGHMMGLIKVSSSPSVSVIERSKRENLEGEVGVAVVPGVEGRIFHVHPEGRSETES